MLGRKVLHSVLLFPSPPLSPPPPCLPLISISTAGHTYGKLCPWSVGSAELAAESEADFVSSEKKSKNDFALWKVRNGRRCEL